MATAIGRDEQNSIELSASTDGDVHFGSCTMHSQHVFTNTKLEEAATCKNLLHVQAKDYDLASLLLLYLNQTRIYLKMVSNELCANQGIML